MTSRRGTRWFAPARRRACAPLLLAGALFAAACQQEPPAEEKAEAPPEVPAAPSLILTPVSLAEIPGYGDDRISEALPALKKSCLRLRSLPDDRPLGPDGQAGTVRDWRPPCAAIGALRPDDEPGLRRVLERWFAPFQAATMDGETGLFTGYYEAELRGYRGPERPEAEPLYALPEDLVTVNLGRFRADLDGQRIFGRIEGRSLVPYYSRKEIESGALAGRATTLLWAEDAVAAFFLHVQGSGRVILPDGEVVRVGFAGSNGHGFTAIGRLMIERGLVGREGASMQVIRDWLRAHPERAREIMQENARFIFFRTIDGEGPIGAQGVALTAGRSLAVDPDFIALGLPVFLDTSWPASTRPLRRLMVAQDKGAAIKGPIRGDVYWGSGPAALEYAGRMKEQGRLYLLLPKSVAARRQAGS